MKDLNSILENERAKFREVFKYSANELQKRIDGMKPSDVEGDVFTQFPSGSSGKMWQADVLNMLENEISKDIYLKFNEILAERKNYHCSGCATCCNLACSEFSPEELKEKAQNGDNFAQQFLSVFIPYNSKEEAREVYPEYIELLEKNKEYDVYFYHCPKLTEDKRCSDYENRPQICRDFPDNPLSILPDSCGYKKWKEEVEPIALMLHSMVEIIDFYCAKINSVL